MGKPQRTPKDRKIFQAKIEMGGIIRDAVAARARRERAGLEAGDNID